MWLTTVIDSSVYLSLIFTFYSFGATENANLNISDPIILISLSLYATGITFYYVFLLN